jgi:PAS domain S-box-containing protein
VLLLLIVVIIVYIVPITKKELPQAEEEAPDFGAPATGDWRREHRHREMLMRETKGGRDMKLGNNVSGVRAKLIRRAAWLVCVVICLFPAATRAQADAEPKRVLVLYWYDKDFHFNAKFDQGFQAALQSAPTGSVEYYAEYLESNRFPGESQSQLFRDYLRHKYADRSIDVIVASGYVTLEFLIKYRDGLFPQTPIVFLLTARPTTEQLASVPALTGITTLDAYKKNLDLVLRLHPETEQVFVIGGTLERDKKLEAMAREQLQSYESRVRINYLTDLPPDELIAKTKRLPERSIVLYVWQQAQDEQGKVLEFVDILTLVRQSSPVPIYGMASWHVGSGIVGGYVNTPEGSASRAAEIALRIINGERAQDIPVESDQTVPMFDWRELRRWGISEDLLPPGSVVRFKELSFWNQYRWQIIGVISLCLVEAFLIFALLAQRARRRRAEEGLRSSEEKFSKAFRASPDVLTIVRLSDGHILDINDLSETLLGYSRDEMIGRTTLELNQYANPEDRAKFFRLAEEQGFVRDFETDFRNKGGNLLRVSASAEQITINKDPCLIIIARDITERKRAEEALREASSKLELIVNTSPLPITSADADGRITGWNKAAERLFGWTEEEAVGRMCPTVPPEEREKYLGTIHRVMEGETYLGLVQYRQKKSGDLLSCSIAAAPQRNGWGEPVGVTTIIEDITERKRVEEEKRKLIHDLDERVKELTALHRAARILQQERAGASEILREIALLLPPAFQYPEITAGRVRLGEIEYTTPGFTAALSVLHAAFTTTDGQPGSIEVVYTEERPPADEGPYLAEERALINTLADMLRTDYDHRRAEESLRESERRFSDTLTNIEMIAVMADINGDITFCNDYLLRLTDWQREEAIGRNWYEMFLPEDEKKRVREILGEADLTGDVTVHMENEIKTRSGERRLVKWTNTTLRGLDGKVIGLAALGDDITERKRAEEELMASHQRLRALSESLRKAKEDEGIRIAREIHDELGSALTSLKWSLLRLDKGCSGNGNPDSQSGAREEIDEMVGLVDTTINTVRRIASELRPGVLDDLGLIPAIEWHAQQFQEHTGIVCRFDSLIESVGLNREQATAVFRVFQEAMTNILRHAQATKVNIIIEEEESEFVLEIKDNGRGITESERLGVGSLGLLGMRERAHSVGGKVEINGMQGKGTVLIVRLPITGGTAS